MVETELAHPTRTQPAQQRGWALVNFDAAALGVTALSREHHDHFVAVEEPLRLAAIGLPDLSDLGAPKKESLVTLIDGRVEYTLGEVKTYGRVDQLLELAPARAFRARRTTSTFSCDIAYS
jgi:hypothetical protein